MSFQGMLKTRNVRSKSNGPKKGRQFHTMNATEVM